MSGNKNDSPLKGLNENQDSGNQDGDPKDDNVTVELNQSQFDALVAWTFNLGVGNLRQSTMLRKLNEGDYQSVPSEMNRWNKAGGKTLDGLIRRRKAEGLLFESKEWHTI